MDEKELTVQIGRRFRAFRVTQGLSQKQIAVVLSIVTHSNISRLERGAIQRLSLTFLKNCQLKFGLSIDWLLTGQGSMVSTGSGTTATATKLSAPKGRKARPGRTPLSKKQNELHRTREELFTSLTRVTQLVQELVAHATGRDARAKKK